MILFVLLTLLLALAVHFIKYQYSYWERRGFPYDHDSKIPFGCLGSVSKREKSMGIAIYDIYLKSKERFTGIYLLFRPAVLVRDVELVRHILTQDFGSFHDRGVYVDEEKDPLSANLFSLRGQSWHSLRQKLGPSFTSGKLKEMYSTSEDIGNKMVAHMKTLLPDSGESKELNLKAITTTYAIDIIASVIFGLDINSFENPKNKFRGLATTATENTLFNAIVGMLVFLCPGVAKFIFRIFNLRNPVAVAMLDIMKDTVEYRDKHKIVRRDMLQLLMQLRNTDNVDSIDEKSSNKQIESGHTKSFSLELIAAQAFIFYIAGQETTAAAAAFTLFELAQYPELLKRAQAEVDLTLKNNDGKINYETLQKMEFLELCILETLRKYPGLPMLNRECTQDYRIPGTDHTIEKGTAIVISLFGIHRDPENFPDPNKYDPDRFSKSNQNYNPHAYMPFGDGPRICIAQRMGKINSKLAIVKILENFNIEIMEKREIEIDNYSVVIMPKGGLKVRLSNRKKQL